jgi:hypothetical protein
MPQLVRTLFSALGIGTATTGSELKTVADRRRAPRFQTELALRWPGGTGLVRDISATGVRFETNQPISPHEKMKFTIVIPDDEGGRSHYTLCDSEIQWTAPSRIEPHKLTVGASLTTLKSVSLPLAA